MTAGECTRVRAASSVPRGKVGAMRPADVPPEVIDQVRRLHASIDGSARRLEVLHEPRLQCRRGCSDCCVDDLTVSIAEAARIVEENAELLVSGAPGPAGGCALSLIHI